MKTQYYFGSKDDEICYDIEHFQANMVVDKVDTIEVFKAIPERISGVFWCKVFQEWGERNDYTCGKHCKEYDPRNGRSGCCKHYSNISYEAGEKVILKYTGN